MNRKEGIRRVAVLLRFIGWLALGVSLLVTTYGVVTGHISSIGDGIPILFMFGCLALGGVYILSGFAGESDQNSQSSTTRDH